MTEPNNNPELEAAVQRDERQYPRKELDEYIHETVGNSMETVQKSMEAQFEDLKKLIEKGKFPCTPTRAQQNTQPATATDADPTPNSSEPSRTLSDVRIDNDTPLRSQGLTPLTKVTVGDRPL